MYPRLCQSLFYEGKRKTSKGRLATMLNGQRQYSKDLEQGRLGLLIKFRFGIWNENINEKNEN